jgi:hypothetical protein
MGCVGLRAQPVICYCLSAKLESSFSDHALLTRLHLIRYSKGAEFPSTHLNTLGFPRFTPRLSIYEPLSLRVMTAGVSPSSSPRLPSPPPFTEVQIGPQSPSFGESCGKDAELFRSAGDEDGSTRRIRPGTKTADMAFGPPLIPLSQVCTSSTRRLLHT